MNRNILQARQLGRIGVLMGGCSSEREISLKSGKAVFKALKQVGADVVSIEINTVQEDQILVQLAQSQIDIAFLVLHGKFGEDGHIQTILQKAQIAYTGSDSAASQLAMDKAATQLLLQKVGIRVPDFFVLNKKEESRALEFLKKLGGCPVVVRPHPKARG